MLPHLSPSLRFALIALFAGGCLVAAPVAAADSAADAAKQAETADKEKPKKRADKRKKKREKPAAESKSSAKRKSDSSEEKPEKIRYAEFRITEALPESPGGAGPFAELRVDLRKQIVRIDRAAEDDSIQGLVLRIREAPIGRGQQHELREAIKRFRATGKQAIAELEVATTANYLVACACDEIVMPESGFLIVPGVRAEPLFFKGMLAKIGVEADFVHVGEAKGAAEPFTRRRWSKPVKENITSLLDDLYEQMIATVAKDRPMTRAEVVEAIDRGLLTATDAKQAGLVDTLAYAGDVRATLTERHGADELVYVRNYGQKDVDTDFSGPAGFFKLLGMMAGGGKGGSRAGKKVAVVYAVGPIMTGESEVDPFGESDSVGSTTVVEALDKAARDKRTAAIVLRVASPGGSAVASDLIWSKIQEIDKPVVASMGDVAASGGYYISMGADRVYAEPTTVTGSIGVVGGKMAVKGMLGKLGITSDLISRGSNSGMFSAMEKFSKTERAALVALMDDTYDQFTAKAAEGRGLSQDRVKELGGGKVYTGRQAMMLGLVDEIGDLRAAVAGAKELAGLEADEKVRIETYPKAVDFFDQLFGKKDGEREVRAAVDHVLSLGGAAPEVAAAARQAAWLRRVFAREPVAVVMPFGLTIE